MSRDGFYGSVTVFISDGFPDGQYSGFSKGFVKPSVSNITFNNNEAVKEFSVQVICLSICGGEAHWICS